MQLGMTRAAMLESMSQREYQEWRIMAAIEPFGIVRDDVNMATIASVFANCHRGKNSKPFSLDDFRYSFEATPKARDRRRRKESRAKIESGLRNLASRKNGH